MFGEVSVPALRWLFLEIQDGKRLLFDHFARRSDAKDADRRAVDASEHRPAALDDESIPVGQRVLLAERLRLGLDDQ